MMNALISFYSPSYPTVLVYMLQSTEYQIGPYLRWFWRTQNFNRVRRRGDLRRTKAARLLLLGVRLGILLEIALGVLLICLWPYHHLAGGWEFGLALIIAYPVVWGHLIVLPLVLGRWLIVRPRSMMQIVNSEKIFADSKAAKIAVAGSYGKTSTKEVLMTILSEGKNVAATPANKNVASSHVIFASSLTGKEDILIIEYGEGAPGDVRAFARVTHPTHGIITGLAPAHLDKYKTLQAAGADIFSLASYLDDHNVFVNIESPAVQPFMKPSFEGYSEVAALGWTISARKVSLSGTSFVMEKGKHSLKLHSNLLGEHLVGTLALGAALAVQFGLSDETIISGVAKTKPFEHRMQPYQLHGAWIIDDTYNGNIEGVRAGTKLLAALRGKRKIYVTPGLVDQGKEVASVHEEVGKLIAVAYPEIVVLMKNSVTEYIQAGLEEAGFSGKLMIEPHPLSFYTNLDQFVADGDVVMLQNDWPDQYS